MLNNLCKPLPVISTHVKCSFAIVFFTLFPVTSRHDRHTNETRLFAPEYVSNVGTFLAAFSELGGKGYTFDYLL